MIGFERAARQIGAAWAMAWNRDGWRESLDRSVDGVFASFAAILFAFPFYVISYASIRRAAAKAAEKVTDPILTAPAAIAIPSQVLGVLADWFGSLAVLIAIARFVGADKRAAELIAGYNWIQAPISAAQAAPLLIIGLLGASSATTAFYMPAVALVFALLWGVLRRSLETDAMATIGIIALLTLIGLVLQTAVTSLALSVLGVFV